MLQLRYYRLALLISLLIVVPLGYKIRFMNLSNLEGVSDFLGSVFYQVCLILTWLLLFPRSTIVKVAIAVFFVSCAIEFLQLWQPPFLQAIRATVPGRLILGNTFTPSDFPAYAVGSGVGWGWANRLKQS